MQFKPLNSVIKIRVLKNNVPTDVELRFASTPALPIPEIVLRSQSDVIDQLDKVGLLPAQHDQILRALDEPQGIFLVTGPVGSGKTNTLLGCCSYLQGPDNRKIMESGDPIEVYSDFRTQVPITKHASWMDVFHSKLRMNPDTMYLGELRSVETVSVALEAALTGHLVLSTFHTINVAGTFTRLFKMGIPRDLLADGLNAILSQRLVRVLCMECRTEDAERTAAMLNPSQLARGLRIYKPDGCPECFGTGFKGRTAVIELLVMNDDIRDAIIAGVDSKEIVAAAVKSRIMLSMQQVARYKIFQGTTSFKEVHRVMKLAVEDVMTDFSPSRAAQSHSSASDSPEADDNAAAIDAEYEDVTT
jgi:type II secretory ATPase GspE/PulE/Tfp pilus assembly ATPase PilB-like protein